MRSLWLSTDARRQLGAGQEEIVQEVGANFSCAHFNYFLSSTWFVHYLLSTIQPSGCAFQFCERGCGECLKDVAKMKTLYIVQRAALSSCHVQHVLLTVAVELPPEIPYCPPNAMDVADPHAHFIYVWYRQYQLETYETEWKSFKCCQTYVVQLEKSISQRCDTKCCLTNVVADLTIIECDEHVILWGKMFDCNRVIIGLDLGVGDLF